MQKIIMTLILSAIMVAEAAHVMTWVPPYRPHVQNSWKNLNADFGGVGMKDGLTHLALQFWLPTTSGGLIKDDKYKAIDISDSVVAKYVKWGNENNVKVLLCVYNNDGKWNWELARSAFADNKTTFINNLISEMERLNLDGIELDLEGPGVQSKKDEAALMVFVRDLSVLLKEKGKELTIATFASKWHVPGTQMWTDLAPFVDAITSMGYHEIGKKAANGLSYDNQKSFITKEVGDLMMGMPAWVDKWLGNTTSEQLDWAVNDGTVGVAIWDAGLGAASWKTAEVWFKLKAIKNGSGNVFSSKIPASSKVPKSSTPKSSTLNLSSAKSSSTSVKPECVTWKDNICLWESDGYVCPSDKITSDGKKAFTCTSGSNSVWCSVYGPNENDWGQWEANGTCDGVSAVLPDNKNVEVGGRKTSMKSGEWQLITLNGSVVQFGKAKELAFSLKNQESGVYFLRVTNKGFSSLIRLNLR